MFYARSPRSAHDKYIPAQTYQSHVEGVITKQEHYLEDIAPYCSCFDCLKYVSLLAGTFHDLGKLEEANQQILSGVKKAKALPVHHWDAGVACIGSETLTNNLSSVLVYGHHIGLKNQISEYARGDLFLRDESAKEYTDKNLDKYKEAHNASVILQKSEKTNGDSCVVDAEILSSFLRVAMSCLVDADHTDSAVHCGEFEEREQVPLLPEKRLQALNSYIKSIENDKPDLPSNEKERNETRHEMYVLCAEADCKSQIYSCDSPVGTGKTTAIMSFLLKAAKEKNLRRIFVVLPYTNIIDQSVQVYRNALVLTGENPEDVVSALHHRTEYEDENTRQFSALWNAPIIVTTAVQFFETLAASNTSALRKLHNLPGSAIFIDESHAALPAKLWVQAWDWIKCYSKNWNCHFVLASGSLNRFWKIKEFDDSLPEIPEILPDSFREKLQHREKQRVEFKFNDEKMNEIELCAWIDTLPGPRLLIVNTVQSAAVIASKMNDIYGRESVEHISTALTPNDRKKTLDVVKTRLRNKNDKNWTLVATSCVEAGVDFSFRTGIREAASLVSLLQIAGRVKRNNEADYSDSTVWTVQLKFDGLLKPHPTFDDSSKVLLDLANKQEPISPSLCTKALRDELIRGCSFKEEISQAERTLQFETVAEKFRVINSDTASVIIDGEVVEKLRRHERVDWKEIQASSVQIWSNRINNWGLEEIRTGMYFWNYEYNNFIGYMAGVLSIEKFKKEGFAIL